MGKCSTGRFDMGGLRCARGARPSSCPAPRRPRFYRAAVSARLALPAAMLLFFVLFPAGCGRDAPPPPPAGPYVASRSSGVVHRSDCTYAARIKPANRVTYATLRAALDEGRRPCKRCLPRAASQTTQPGGAI